MSVDERNSIICVVCGSVSVSTFSGKCVDCGWNIMWDIPECACGREMDIHSNDSTGFLFFCPCCEKGVFVAPTGATEKVGVSF